MRLFKPFITIFLLATALMLSTTCIPVWAQESEPPKRSDAPRVGGDDEFLSGPSSEYGEFNSDEDEIEDEKFFQYGRFFGVGLGVGFTSATGNAGKIYQGGFPTIDFRLDYWFDFHVALQIAIQNSKHSYNLQPDGATDTNLFRTLIQAKYYFDTRDLSAPITFIGPHLILGGGFYQRTDNVGSGNTTTGGTTQTQQAVGMNLGLGFELTLKPKKVYVDIETLGHLTNFSDQNDPKFAKSGISDRSGMWISTVVALLWTW